MKKNNQKLSDLVIKQFGPGHGCKAEFCHYYDLYPSDLSRMLTAGDWVTMTINNEFRLVKMSTTRLLKKRESNGSI